MKKKEVIDHIVAWLKDYSDKSNTSGFVVGISGGIDSALTSTLCAKTGKQVICLNMPILQQKAEYDRGHEHIGWLKKQYGNVSSHEVELTQTFQAMEQTFPAGIRDWLTMANTRARLRMTTLYAFACHHKMLVAGTGNKVEDFGIGFFTKYGDGGVDLSPIAGLMKSEVFMLAQELGIVDSIRAAKPTDGLFSDGRSDEDQIGATYDELEWAMTFLENRQDTSQLSGRQKTVLEIYTRMHKANQHKMNPIPVCEIPKELKS
ncbi:MAG: NH(3)-dependent synthetase [Bacteroidetes bacterium]|nr:NH(3)-dependent synthetase [Bacteroidota bacterium]